MAPPGLLSLQSFCRVREPCLLTGLKLRSVSEVSPTVLGGVISGKDDWRAGHGSVPHKVVSDLASLLLLFLALCSISSALLSLIAVRKCGVCVCVCEYACI